MNADVSVADSKAIEALWNKVKLNYQVAIKSLTKAEWDSLDVVQKDADILYFVKESNESIYFIYKSHILGQELIDELHQKSNLNILDNWYFLNPVNRLGKSTYSGQGVTIDRWLNKSQQGSLMVTDNGIISKDRNQTIAQKHDRKLNLIGTTLTASVLFKDSGLLWATKKVQNNFQIVASSTSILFEDSSDEMELFKIEVPIDDYVVAVKLELGSTQTLAHQDSDGNWNLNAIPNYAAQYAICKQYDRDTGNFNIWSFIGN